MVAVGTLRILQGTGINRWHIAACGLMVCLACGSAVESGRNGLSTARTGANSGDSSASALVLAVYDVSVNPLATQIQFQPQALPLTLQQLAATFLPSYTAQVLPAAALQISQGSTYIYDDASNKIRLAGPGNTGLCIKNVESKGRHFINTVVKVTQFTPSGVVAVEGAESISGGFQINYGDIANGRDTCRPFALVDTGGQSYRFAFSVEGTLSDTAPTNAIEKVSSTSWLVGDTISVAGSGLSPKGGAAVCITSDYSEKPFCNSGYLVSSLTSETDSELVFDVTSDMSGQSGFLVVDNGAGVEIVGPYITWTTALNFNLALPSGSTTTTVLIRTWEGATGLDSNNCPAASGLDDSERINHVALSSSQTSVDMSFLQVSGLNKNVALVVDMDHNGIPNAGDYVALVAHSNINGYQLNQPFNPVQLAFGSAHGCGIDSNGALYCWGDNTSGQLGDGTTAQHLTPTLVPSLTSGVTAVSVGDTDTCVIHNGAAKCWGGNAYGQLGDGTTDDHLTPAVVNGLDSGVTAIATGENHSCAIQSGAVICWGNNASGQLGDGTTDDQTKPVQVSGLTADATAVAIGNHHSCAIVNGAAKCWGSNIPGQLGVDTSPDSGSSIPLQVTGLETGVTAITAGALHTCAIAGGAAYCWGYNGAGQLGDGSGTYNDSTTPLPVLGLTSGVTTVAAGATHTCAVVSDAAVCWGANSVGQLGDGTQNGSDIPVGVAGMGSNVSAVKGGGAFSCAVQNHTLSCWGGTGLGVLGDGTSTIYYTPVQVYGLTSGVTSIAGGKSINCAVVSGAVKCWGNGGAVGDGTTIQRNVPTQVSGLTSGMITVGGGSYHMCAINSSGALKCWGAGGFGELGDGSGSGSLTPVQVSGLTSGVTAVSGAYYQSCAVVNGGAKCWGFGQNGQLGDGAGTNSTVPVQVSGLPAGSSVTAIANGDYHSCAVVNGGVKCWGINFAGQLGDGTTNNSLTPVQVSGLPAGSGATAVVAGWGHTCALVSGAMKCWGINNTGQLGDGTKTERHSPVTVTGLSSGVTAIAAQDYHSCAIVSGAAKCWGFSGIGDGTTGPTTTPAAVQGMSSGVTAISTSGTTSCSVKSGGMSCWGQGYYAETGDNTPFYRATPAPVSGSVNFPGHDILFSTQITGSCPG